MPQNYATKYSDKIAERFKKKSITTAASGNEYSFVGAKTVKISSVDTVALNDFNRTGASNRFGSVSNLGDTVQEMTCSQDKGFTFAIDAGDNSDKSIDMAAGKALSREIDEVIVPTMDKYRFKKWVMGANVQTSMGSAPTKSTIVGDIIDLNAKMTDALVPMEGRTLYISTAYYKLLKQDSGFLGVDTLGKDALSRGVVGEVDGCAVVPVPTNWLPSNVYFMIKYKGASVDPVKLQNYDVLPKVQGFDGPVVQGRLYYDAFVIGTKGDGIAVSGSSDAILAAPAMSIASHAVSIAAASGVSFLYTTDGTNPRYSDTAAAYSTAVTLTTGQTMRAIGTKDGCVGIEGTQAYA